MKAIILAGGYSKRLWPLTTELPKSFLEFDGKPVIDHIMEQLDDVELIDEVIVSTNRKFEYFFVYWIGKSTYKTKISLHVEDSDNNNKKLGAIGAINHIAKTEQLIEDFLVVSGDNLFEFNLDTFVKTSRARGETSLAVKDVQTTSRFSKLGVVSLDDNLRVKRFKEKPVDDDSTIVCSGVYYFAAGTGKLIHTYLTDGNSADSTGFLLEWLVAKDEPVWAWPFDEAWFDIGTHASLDEAKKYYRDIKGTVLITGGVGYVGYHVADLLYQDGFNVKILDLLIYGFEPDSRYDFVLGDVRNSNDVKKAMEGVDYVVHLAALSNDPSVDLSPDKGIEINYNSTKLVASIAKEFGVKRFLFPSSCSVYGDIEQELLNEDDRTRPLTLYAHTKLASENVLRSMANEHFDVCMFRYGTLFGHSGFMRFDLVANVVPIEAIVDKEILLFGDGGQRRPMLHVRDAARAMVIGVKSNQRFDGAVFNIGDDAMNYTVAKLTHEIQEHLFPEINIKVIPEKMDTRSYSVDFSRAREKLGFHAEIDIITGVGEMSEKLKAGYYGNPRADIYFRVKHLKNSTSNRLGI